MPQARSIADALSVVTITFVALFILLGLLCILYSLYFRRHVSNQGQLSYFGGPWAIRITFILFAIWWSIGEVVRLNYLRQEGQILNSRGAKWQENICKGYIVSNFGFAEPCLFLTLTLLLRASLQNADSGTLSPKWNLKTACCILLACLPVFVVELVFILITPEFSTNGKLEDRLPSYFTQTAYLSKDKNGDDVAFCTYPLISTIFLGLIATSLTIYLLWLGRQILNLVINKGLRKRVYLLLFSVSSFFLLRILFLGLSVLSEPEHYLFEAFSFLSFLSLLCCSIVGIYFLVYCPVADGLALRNLQDLEARRRFFEEHNATLSLLANQGQGHVVEMDQNSPEISQRGSISFRIMERGQSSRPFVELSLFSPSQHSSPPGSPQPLGWPMLSSTQDRP